MNGALAEAQATVLGNAELLSKANDSITDLKLKLEGLEGTLSEVRAREETLTKDLENEKQLRRNDAANHEDYVKGKTSGSVASPTSPAGSPRSWLPWGCQT